MFICAFCPTADLFTIVNFVKRDGHAERTGGISNQNSTQLLKELATKGRLGNSFFRKLVAVLKPFHIMFQGMTINNIKYKI